MAGAIRYQMIIGNTVNESCSASYTGATLQELVLATGSTDTAVALGGVTTIDILYIKSDQALTLNINADSGTNIAIDANKPFFMAGTALTAIYLSNASGTDANVVVKMWGA
jgi:hypothetical protein